MSLRSFFNKLIGKGHHNRDDRGETPLYCAARKGNAYEVRRLLEKGADPNARNHKGLTPLHEAAYWGEAEIVRLLLKYKADPKADNGRGWTPLHSAALSAGLSGRKKIMDMLLDAGADPARKDKNGWCASDYAGLWDNCPPNAPRAAEVKQMHAVLGGAERKTDSVRKKNSWSVDSLSAKARSAFALPVARPAFSSSRRAALNFHFSRG